jgi:alanine-glyoxylate transaminase/serine-glyoxylate transaminase/serine-pyruvate transaminase
MGLVLHADKNHRASVVTAVRVPQGVEEARVRQGLLNEFGIEIAGGLGQLKGKIWRIGLMGYSSSEENVLRLLMTLEKLLTREGYKVEPNAGVRAALEVFSKK